jgi:nucleotide-binding universal stress UspA family protein
MYERIVVALDGSPAAEQILPHVRALAHQFGARLTLVQATIAVEQVASSMEPTMGGAVFDPELIEEALESGEDAATSYLDRLAANLRADGLDVDVEHPPGSADDVIFETAQRLKADLIALTTHGRGGLEKLVFGSVAESVVRKSNCPVLLVRST